MNLGDTPHVPCAMVSAFRRRLRCVAMRPKFTQNPGEMRDGSRIFLVDGALKDWIRGPEATSVLRAVALTSFI